jgi:hypothetical protein
MSLSAVVVLALAFLLAGPSQRSESQPPKPQLTSPADGFEMSEELTELTWNAVPRARFYGVEIVAVKFSDEKEVDPKTPRIWAFTVADKTFLSIDPLDYPDGEYQWSVAPFSDMMLMGPFSEPRTFIVRKQIKGEGAQRMYLVDFPETNRINTYWTASNLFTLRKRTYKYGTAVEFNYYFSMADGHDIGDDDMTWEALSGEWALLEAVVGIADQYPTQGSAVVTFETTTLDGRVRSYKTERLVYGADPVPIHAPMKNVVRLRILFTANRGDDDRKVYVVLGDPVLIPPKR